MVKTFSEEGFEEDFLRWLNEDLGWDRYRGSELDRIYNRDKTQLIYWDILKEKLKEINDEIDDSNVEDLINSIKRELTYENLLEGNKEFLEVLRKGKQFTYQEDGERKTKYINLIDFENIERNSFIVVNQFGFRQRDTIWPDIVLFINGIPLVIGELKSKTQEKDYYDAVDDLKEYEEKAPSLFIPSLFNIASDEIDYRYGALGAPHEHFHPWREVPPEYENIEEEVSKAAHSMLNKETLLDLLRYFGFYGHKEGKSVKIIPRYMQYYATNRIVNRIREGNHKRGLIWHTQGAGKSYTMMFAAYKIQKTRPINNPKIIILVDKDKLNKQMRDDFYDIGFPNFVEARSGNHLESLLENSAAATVLTTIQKFQDVNTVVQDDNVVVLSDEAHRFMEQRLGSKLEATLPKSYNFGFTGTPVRERERDTFRNFMPEGKDEEYLHRYSIAQGIRDKLILPVYFEPKQPIWDLDEEELEKLDIDFEGEFSGLSIEQKDELIKKFVNKSSLAELRPRVREIVKEINKHYNKKLADTEYKAMIVTPSRRAAAIYKEEMDKERNPEETAVIYSGAPSSEHIVNQYYKNPEEIDNLIKRFENPEENLQMLIVCDMLLSGFDAPILKVMYLDRALKNHNLLQAIARTNRPREGKNNGLIVDFQRVFENLDEALDYPEEVKRSAAKSSEDLKKEFEETLNQILDLFNTVDFEDSTKAINQCIVLLDKNPERRRIFKEKFRKLQDLYETITPDEFLVRDDIDKNYKLVNQIYLAYRRKTTRQENPEKNLRKRTLDLIEEHIDVKGIKNDYPVYKLSHEHLEKLEGLEPDEKAAEIGPAIQEHVKDRVGKNPRYERISQKVQRITSQWQSGEIMDQVAAEKLEDLEKEVIEFEETSEKKGLTEGEFAILTLLEDEYSSHVDEEEKEKIAKDIGEAFNEVDTSFEGWETNEVTIKHIRRKIIEVLHKHGKLVLHRQGFTSKALEYLIENEGEL